MPVIDSLIRSEADGTISFGNYKLETKSKLQDLSMQEIYIRLRHFMKSRNWKGTDCLSMSPFPEPQQTIFLQIQME